MRRKLVFLQPRRFASPQRALPYSVVNGKKQEFGALGGQIYLEEAGNFYSWQDKVNNRRL